MINSRLEEVINKVNDYINEWIVNLVLAILYYSNNINISLIDNITRLNGVKMLNLIRERVFNSVTIRQKQVFFNRKRN